MRISTTPNTNNMTWCMLFFHEVASTGQNRPQNNRPGQGDLPFDPNPDDLSDGRHRPLQPGGEQANPNRQLIHFMAMIGQFIQQDLRIMNFSNN